MLLMIDGEAQFTVGVSSLCWWFLVLLKGRLIQIQPTPEVYLTLQNLFLYPCVPHQGIPKPLVHTSSPYRKICHLPNTVI